MPMQQWGDWSFINAPLSFTPFFLLLIVWSLGWKGLALWHSGRRGQPWWFVILLVVNTIGILEIVYLFGVAKLKFNVLFTKTVHHGH